MGQDSSTRTECEFNFPVHEGPVEWHHPISSKDVGLDLCQLHHSLVQGRKQRRAIEMVVNWTVAEMRADVMALECQRVIEQGAKLYEIDKR